MALKRDMGDVPNGPEKPSFPPDEVPRFGLLLAQAWSDAHADQDRPHAIEGTAFRLSWAGKCARDLGYQMRGIEASDPPDIADYWRMNTGTMVHNELETVLKAAFPQAQIEYPIDLRPYGVDGSGSGDVFLVDDNDRRIVIEIKTVGGFGFKSLIGRRGPAEGPRGMHLRQAAIQALAMNADELVLCYMSLENLSQREFDAHGGIHPSQKFTAEWTYYPSQFTPIAEAELKRIEKIQELLDENKLPPRAIPDLDPHARITDPARGTWTITNPQHQIIQTGSTWVCGYCSMQTRCLQDGPG